VTIDDSNNLDVPGTLTVDGDSTFNGEISATADENVDNQFYFYGTASGTGKRTTFLIQDPDSGGGSQDESASLEVYKSTAFNAADDGSSAIAVTLANSGSKRIGYVYGRHTDLGQITWGIDSDETIWTSGDVMVGATGTDCGGTDVNCHSGGGVNLSSAGDIDAAGTISATKLIANSSTGDLIIASNASENVFKVAGDGEVFSDVGFSTPAADVAEMFYINGELEAGDVVIIDIMSDETLKKSNRSYDTLVAGVVSTKPGVRLGEGNGSYIALAGRVPVRVTGYVQRGDLLVTSNIPGTAMRCPNTSHCTGAILGKALTNDSGGKVIALISLQ